MANNERNKTKRSRADSKTSSEPSSVVEETMSALEPSITKATGIAIKQGNFVVQSNQLAMHSVDKMIALQANVLKTSFEDMQKLVEAQGQPSTKTANASFQLMMDRSMEHLRTTLSATQEMHKAYLTLMEGYLQIIKKDKTP